MTRTIVVSKTTARIRITTRATHVLRMGRKDKSFLLHYPTRDRTHNIVLYIYKIISYLVKIRPLSNATRLTRTLSLLKIHSLRVAGLTSSLFGRYLLFLNFEQVP